MSSVSIEVEDEEPPLRALPRGLKPTPPSLPAPPVPTVLAALAGRSPLDSGPTVPSDPAPPPPVDLAPSIPRQHGPATVFTSSAAETAGAATAEAKFVSWKASQDSLFADLLAAREYLDGETLVAPLARTFYSPSETAQRAQARTGVLCVTNYRLLFAERAVFERLLDEKDQPVESSSASSSSSSLSLLPQTSLPLLQLGAQLYSHDVAVGRLALGHSTFIDSDPTLFFSIPLGLLSKIDHRRKRFEVRLTLKSVRFACFWFKTAADSTRIALALQKFAWPDNPQLLFAFANAAYRPAPSTALAAKSGGFFARAVKRPTSGGRALPDDGWNVFRVEQEFERMGVDNHPAWRVTAINAGYAVCDTYPRLLAVPTSISDETVQRVARFRSRGRFPILSYLHGANQATITRCSQPQVGLQAKRSRWDEEFLAAIRAANPGSEYFVVLDARPKVNAAANMAAGAGYENVSNYAKTSIEFLNIENIHVMRKSLQKVRELCLGVDDGSATATHAFYTGLVASKWLDHIRGLLLSSLRVVRLVSGGISTLVHCSDGWDRTSQMVSLALLLLDPFHRTLLGFEVLIEKEWCSHGHKFADRCAQMNKANESESSPIFLQFVECVWQLMQQFPDAFEFNETLLLFLLEHVYSCQFGTFLFNTVREREHAALAQKTPSVWTAVNRNAAFFTNPCYAPARHQGVLDASADSKYIHFWTGYYMAHASPPALASSAQLSMLATLMAKQQSELLAEIRRLEHTLTQYRQRLGESPATSRVPLLRTTSSVAAAPRQQQPAPPPLPSSLPPSPRPLLDSPPPSPSPSLALSSSSSSSSSPASPVLPPRRSLGAAVEPTPADEKDPFDYLLRAAEECPPAASSSLSSTAPRPRKMSRTAEDLLQQSKRPLPARTMSQSDFDIDTRSAPRHSQDVSALAWDAHLGHLPAPVRSALPEVGKILYSGFVSKRGSKRKNWTRRLAVLHQHSLQYFKSIEDSAPKGSVKLNATTKLVVADAEWKAGEMIYGFTVTTGSRSLTCRVPHAESRAKWVEAIQQCLHSHQQDSRSSTDSIQHE